MRMAISTIVINGGRYTWDAIDLNRARGWLHCSNAQACCSWCIESSVHGITVSTSSLKRQATSHCSKISISRFSRRNQTDRKMSTKTSKQLVQEAFDNSHV